VRKKGRRESRELFSHRWERIKKKEHKKKKEEEVTEV
jgi:hypothetical protein